jgi:hypothetical protein
MSDLIWLSFVVGLTFLSLVYVRLLGTKEHRS